MSESILKIAWASKSLEWLTGGTITSRVKPKTLKLVFTACVLGVQHQRDSGGKQVGKFISAVNRKST